MNEPSVVSFMNENGRGRLAKQLGRAKKMRNIDNASGFVLEKLVCLDNGFHLQSLL